MRAASYSRLGAAAEVLAVAAAPVPGPAPGEVLVRVAASGINPSDVKKRAGWLGGSLEFPRIVPHSDGAGTIEAVGAGVPGGRVGERVWLYNAQWERADGTAADYVALPAALAVPLPEAAGFEAGACLGVPACTAHFAVFAHGPVAGLTVLVQGGAGVVGRYAVQMARLGGATVIATVSSAAKADVAREAGATHVVDYRREDVESVVLDLTGGTGVDRIVEVDLGANAALDASVLRRGGGISSYSSTRRPHFELDYYAFGYKGARLAFVQVYLLGEAERRAAIADITRWLAADALTHRIAARFPLSRIAEAHALQESGTAQGKVLVVL